MTRLWLADVHANLPAFEAVLADAGEVDEVVFLGDVVGYGPHPAACVERLMSLGARAVLGNHDAAVLAWRERAAAPAVPLNWDQWTLGQLGPAHLAHLAALPETLSVLATHVVGLTSPLTHCGHTHRARDRTVTGRRLISLPAVGQPRNGDLRAGYALEHGGGLAFHLVAYDVARVLADLERIGLPEAFLQRWTNFVRTGFDVEWSREYQPEDSP
jgi:predicted phosphodiesterase